MSRPTRGAWIETPLLVPVCGLQKSRPTRGAWIETLDTQVTPVAQMSRPTRGAWIETTLFTVAIRAPFVAPHAGRVD